MGLSFTSGTTPAAPNLIITPASLVPGLNEVLILCKGVNYNTEKTLIVQVNKVDPATPPILGVSPVSELFGAAGGAQRTYDYCVTGNELDYVETTAGAPVVATFVLKK